MIGKFRECIRKLWRGGAKNPCTGKYAWLLILFAFACIAFYSPAYGGIPEPGIVLYGKVYDSDGNLLTNGELKWTFIPTGGGNEVTVITHLTQIDVEGGPFSYRVTVPLESTVTGSNGSGDAISISDNPVEYIRTATLTGTSITRSDTVLISTENRGTFEHVSIGSPAIVDEDGDNMDDTLELRIVNADPDDNINSIEDVYPNGDFDHDGESNEIELYNGTDPTDAFSTYDFHNAYKNFHFEIYRGAEQGQAGEFTESFWGAKLICWPRDGEQIDAGSLTKPSGTSGDEVIDLVVSPERDEASMEEVDYNSLSELKGDYLPGNYLVKLVMIKNGQVPYSLRFKIKVKPYTEDTFPEYVGVDFPAPGEEEVPVAPLLEFDMGMWDYLYILKTENGQLAYFHYRDSDDVPSTDHQVPAEDSLGPGQGYLLGVDTNFWGTYWLGSQTTVTFTAMGQDCYGDFDEDGDVDGLDLYNFDVGTEDLESFADSYGKIGCKKGP